MLQRGLVFLILGILVFWGYQKCQNDEAHPKEEVQMTTPVKEVIPALVPTQKPRPKPETIKAPAPRSQPMQVKMPRQKKQLHQMPPYKRGFMRWKNVGGWAVSHGDLLQGKINDEVKGVKFGYQKPRPNRLWDSNVISYAIQQDLKNRKPIEDAIKEMNERTVIKLVPWNGQTEDVLVFAKSDELCLSYLGKVLAQQPILISDRCKKDDVIHEIMHALGFVHEQSRVDRDQFVEIITGNILPEFISQFDMMPDELVHEYRGSVFYFDYRSIMLYSDTAFAKEPGLKTMQSKTPTPMPTSKNGLSDIDIERLYYLYGK